MSQRERDRIRVLHEVKQGHVSQVEAAKRLKLSDRQVRRLLLRIAQSGDQAVVHRLRASDFEPKQNHREPEPE